MTGDERSRRSTGRRAAAALGALSAVSVAGCSEGDDLPSGAEDGASPDPDDATDDVQAPVDDDAERERIEDDDVIEEDDETVDADCDDDELARLEDELLDLDEQRFNLEFEIQDLQTGAKATRYLVDQFESGFSSEMMEQGRAVGLAAREGVVTLEILDGEFSTGHATAWFVEEGYLFTNAHNVYAGDAINEVRGISHDGEEFDIEVVDFVEELQPDIALLRTEYRSADPLPMTGVDTLVPGQPLVQVGHPGEVGFWIISMGEFVGSSERFTTDGAAYTALTSVVPGRQGVSGSPVLTLDGEVVGITHGGGPTGEGREMGEPAPVAPDLVFDGGIGGIVVSLHEGSDILEQKLEEWR